MFGDWKPISELRIFGYTIPVQPLIIPETQIKFRSIILFRRRFAPPSFTIPAWKIQPFRPAYGLPIGLYGFLCDFGRSYIRPLLILLEMVAVGSLVFWIFGACGFWPAIGLSFANTLGAFGLRKDLIDSTVISDLPGALKVVAAIQTILGAMLLFLFSLALRNRFRMK